MSTIYPLLLAALIVGSPASNYPPVQIEQSHLIRNIDGSCVWVSLSTLCRHNKQQAGYNLYPKHRGGANEDDVIKALKRTDIKYKIQRRGDKSTAMIDWACKKGYGCAIGVPHHVLVCVHYDSSGVVVINNSGKNALKVQRWSHAKFKEKWNGLVYVIIPKPKMPRLDDPRSHPPATRRACPSASRDRPKPSG